jgi:NAD(P)-dependent dehydrogenase (short-subunit alcohol dehydrogenase family)
MCTQGASPYMNAVKAILVTGASTGIGRCITESLAAEGHFVYAGARKDADLRTLGEIENVQAVRLDVTDSRDISAVADTVRRGGRGLYGLVNNAGVATLDSILDGNDREFERVMATNAHAPYRMTRAFAELIARGKGRIVMIGSTSGILTGGGSSAYSMSKHAIEALTDVLAIEMLPLGVDVSVVEPGVFRTDLVRNAINRGVTYPLPDLSKRQSPDEVAAAVTLALFEPRPKRRYLVVASEEEARRTIGKHIERLVQLNERHSYSYDRGSLIAMLDEALSRSSKPSKELM